MSALDDLKDRIDSAIYTNTEQNITGDGLQTVLDDMVDTMGVSVSQNTKTTENKAVAITVGDTEYNITDADAQERLIPLEEDVIGSYGDGTLSVEDSTEQTLIDIGNQCFVKFKATLIQKTGDLQMQIYNRDSGGGIISYAWLTEENPTQELTYNGDIHHIQLILNTNGSYSTNIHYSYGVKSRLELDEEKIESLEDSVESLGGIVSTKPISEYGHSASGTDVNYSNETIIAYITELANEKSVLKSISFEPKTIGEYTFGIGEIDWRTWGIIRKTFVINVTDTSVTKYDISDSNIILNEGEIIFLYVNSTKTVKTYETRLQPIFAKGADNVYVPLKKVLLTESLVASEGQTTGTSVSVSLGKKYVIDFTNMTTDSPINRIKIQRLPSGLMVYDEKITSSAVSVEYIPQDNDTSIRCIVWGPYGSGASADTSIAVKLGAKMKWETMPYTSIFAEKDEVSEIENTLGTVKEYAETAYNNMAIVYDELGYPYKLSIVNGNIVATGEPIYKKIAFIGNSLMGAFYDSNYGNYGMAATVYSNDVVGDLLKIFTERYANATITRVGGATFEQNLFTDSASFDSMCANIPSDADLIIVRLGENVRNLTDMQAAFTALLNYLKTTYQSARVLLTSTVLNYSAAYNTPLKNSADAVGVDYVDVDGSDYDTEQIGISRMYWQNGELHPSYFTIQTHSNDWGFLKVANAILSAINYKTLKSYGIEVQSSIEYNAPTIGVKDGWITIKTYGVTAPTITVVDSDNNSIPVQSLDLSNYTYDKRFKDGITEDTATFANVFVMPESDVVVTIS